MTAQEQSMDAYLALASLRVVREYSASPISEPQLQRILQAGRATGSSRNKQDWTLYVIRNQDLLAQLADTVFSPQNLRGCQVAIAVVVTKKSLFDAGRIAQNIMLAAWSDGIGSCPNSTQKLDDTKRILGITDDVVIATILSMGHPVEPVGPKGDDPEAILSRIDRKPLDEIVRFID